MTESESHPQSPVESWPQRHQELLNNYLQKIAEIPSVTKVFALSDEKGVFITHVVESDEDEVLDRLDDIDRDLFNQFQDTPIVISQIDKRVAEEARLTERELEGFRGSVIVFQRE